MPYNVGLKEGLWGVLFGKIPPDHRPEITEAIESLEKNPRHRGCIPIGNSHVQYRIRAGRYRICYEIDNKARQVTVFAIRLGGQVL